MQFVDGLIEHFRDPERRKEFFKEYKELEMLYEIISPDAFLRPYMDDYATLSAVYDIVRKAYTKRVMVDRDFQRKTNQLVQEQIGAAYSAEGSLDLVEIDAETVALINSRSGGDNTKVINLVRSIEKKAEEESDDPFLVAMADRARAVQEQFEQRQKSTTEALGALLQTVEEDELRKKKQAEKGLDALTFFVFRTLEEAGIGNPDEVSRKIREAFVEFPNWRTSEGALREIRQKVTFAIFAECEEVDRVTVLVDRLFNILERG